MPKWLKKLLKILGLILLGIIAVLYNTINSCLPGYESLANYYTTLQKFNASFNPSTVIMNSVTTSTIITTKSKMENADRNIFTQNKITYSQLLNYKDSEKSTVELSYSECSFLINSLKNCDGYLMDIEVGNDGIIQNTSFIGMDVQDYFYTIMVKIDIKNIFNGDLDSLSQIIENNLYLTICKDAMGDFNYQINNLSKEDNEKIIKFLSGYIKDSEIYKGYDIRSLGKKLFEEYSIIYQNFGDYVNLKINLK